MANWQTNILEIYGDMEERRRFFEAITKRSGGHVEYDLNGLVPVGPEGPMVAWGSRSGAVDIEVKDSNGVVAFETRSNPGYTLIERISIQFPLLVFALQFIEENLCSLGWGVCASGKYCGGRVNHNVGWNPEWDCARSRGQDPEAAAIDGFEGLEWANLFFGALNVVPRELTAYPEFAERLAAHEAMADRVEDLAPEFEHAQTPLGDRRISLEEFCEKADFLEIRAECRMAVERALEALAATQMETM